MSIRAIIVILMLNVHVYHVECMLSLHGSSYILSDLSTLYGGVLCAPRGSGCRGPMSTLMAMKKF